MSRYSIHARHYGAGRPSSMNRRLHVQQLEQRLTLSADPIAVDLTSAGDLGTYATGGFVAVLPNETVSLNFDFGDVQGAFDRDILITGDTLDLSVVYPSGDIPIFMGSGQTGGLLGDWVDPTGGGINAKLIALPDFISDDPTSGTVPVGPASSAENTPLGKPSEIPDSLETQFIAALDASEVAPSSANRWFVLAGNDGTAPVAQARDNEVIPSRGREVLFRVASITPPQTMIDGEHSSTTHAPATRSTDSRYTSTRTAEELSSETSPEPVNHEAIQLDIAEDPTATVSPSQPSSQTGWSSYRHVSTEVSQPSSSMFSQDEANMKAGEANYLSQQDTEVRHQVFAEWRSRDLIAMPVLTALTAGSLLLRHRCGSDDNNLQLPPERKRK